MANIAIVRLLRCALFCTNFHWISDIDPADLCEEKKSDSLCHYIVGEGLFLPCIKLPIRA